MKRLSVNDIFGEKWFYFFIAAIGVLSVSGDVISGWNGANRFSDDAYYYIVPARNFVESGIFSFDGVNKTNGFHPLWMFLLAVTYKIAGTEIPLHAQIFSVKLVETFLLVLAIWSSCLFAYRLKKADNPLFVGFVGILCLLLYPQARGLFLIGMESTLSMLILIWIIYGMVSSGTSLLFALFPLFFLARLDSLVFIISPIILFYLFRSADSKKRLLLLLFPLGLTVFIYLLSNYLLFDHFKPISGALKSSFPRPVMHLSFLSDPVMYSIQSGRYFDLLIYPNLVNIFCIIIVSSYLLLKKPPEGKGTSLLFLFNGICYLLVLNLLFFQKWNKQIESWYLVLPSLLAIFTLSCSLRSWPAKKAFPGLRSIAVIVLFSVFGAYYLAQAPQAVKEKSYSDGLFSFLDKQSVIGATDCGMVGFWSERRVVNLDGLINSYEYQEAIRDRRLREFLDKNSVTHILVGVWADKPRYQLRDNENMYKHRVNFQAVYGKKYLIEFAVYSYLYNTFSEIIPLHPAQEVFRSKIALDGLNHSRFLLFDIRKPV
ncbi:MAG: hypothetical protein HZA17_13025 [Nitrospirae bacterium]|nr:hypothetical protein [Nitrospirota bacterium]